MSDLWTKIIPPKWQSMLGPYEYVGILPMENYPPPNQIIPPKWQSIFWILLFIIRKKKLLGLWTFEKKWVFGF